MATRLLFLAPLALIVAVACSPTTPEPGKADDRMGGMNMDMSMPAAGDSTATRGYKASMSTMMEAMPAFTGDADVDFMKQMRGHHQAAIDMAEVELAQGADAEAKTLAQNIIRDQRAEIAQIDAWLQKRN